jgi:hypothetical protein
LHLLGRCSTLEPCPSLRAPEFKLQYCQEKKYNLRFELHCVLSHQGRLYYTLCV